MSTDTTTKPEKALTPSQQHRQAMLTNYEAHTTMLMSTLALIYLVTYSLQTIIYHPNNPWWKAFNIFGLILWVLFAIDLLFRFILDPSKRHFLKRNWLDTITVLIPALRALRALRAFTAGGILSKHGKGALSGKAMLTAAIATALIVWVGALMVLNAERGAQGAEITSFGDSIWWAFETITTVGYGDVVPVTPMGRVFAVLVMMVGISVLGVVTASLSAGLVKNTNPPAPAPADEVLAELAALRKAMDALQEQLNNQNSPAQPTDS